MKKKRLTMIHTSGVMIPVFNGLCQELKGWNTAADHHLTRNYLFPDFVSAMAFVNKVGALAEEQGHHPDICFGWGKAHVTWFTHKIKGLHENDFIMAAKTNQLAG